MSDAPDAWAAPLGLAAGDVIAFTTLAASLGVAPAVLLRHIVDRVLGFERDLILHGLGGMAAWMQPDQWVAHSADDAPLTVLGLTPEQITAFALLAERLGMFSATLLWHMVTRLLAADRERGQFGFATMTALMPLVSIIEIVTEYALRTLPLTIRPSGFMWPADKPFPWTEAQCKAAVLGYEVKWPGDFDDFFTLVRGKWEMSDGYAFLHQT